MNFTFVHVLYTACVESSKEVVAWPIGRWNVRSTTTVFHDGGEGCM